MPTYGIYIPAGIIAICIGTLEGWTSPALPYLQRNVTLLEYNVTVTTLGVTGEEASWIGSLANLGAVFGAMPAGPLADKVGRRTLLLAISVPFILGWIIIILANKAVSTRWFQYEL